MEDQKVLKAFVDDSIRDSIQEMKDHISKDLAEFRSMLLEVLGKKATASFEPPKTVMDAKLGQFRGENPEAWIVQAEHYFDFYKIEEDQKLTVASFYFDGEALKWYQWLFRNNQLIDWPHFADKVRIRFKQKGFESTGGRFANLWQVSDVTEYQNHCEDILSSFGESDVLFPGHTYVHSQLSNITNSPQYYGKPSECKSNINECKVFDESSDRYKDVNPLSKSSKPIELSIPPTYLVSSVSRIAAVNGCENDATNKDKNDEEEIVTIRDEPIEFVIANADKPSLWMNSTLYVPCSLAMFDVHKVLDYHWNQLFARHSVKLYPQHGLGLAQCWEEMSYFPSTCSYVKIITRGITGHYSRLDHGALILILNLFPPDHFGLEFPFDPGSSLFTTFIRSIQNGVCWGATDSMNCAKCKTLISGNSCGATLELKFRNTNNVHKDVIVAVTIYRRHYARYFIACSLRWLPKIVEGLDKGIESLDVRGKIREVLLQRCWDNVRLIQRSASGLLVFCPRVFPVQLRHYLTEIVDVAAELLIASQLQKIILVAQNAWPRGGTTQCEMLEKKVCEGVNILMLVWADKISVRVPKRAGPMTTYDEDIVASLQDVDIHYVTCLRSHVDGESLIMDLKLFAMLTLCQQTVRMDCEFSNGESQSRIVLIIGGSSLCAWQSAGALHIYLEALILQMVKIDAGESFNVYILVLTWQKEIPDSNLEDKVLFEDGSIVMNQTHFVRAYGIEAVNEADSVGIIWPSKMMESFTWDPGPINRWFKRTSS